MITCSFCGKTQNEVSQLVQGPAVQICNECVTLCVEIMLHTRPRGESSEPSPIVESEPAP